MLLFPLTFILPFFIEYKTEYYPDYKMEIIQHNLESTPIFDILSGYECENGNTSNIYANHHIK